MNDGFPWFPLMIAAGVVLFFGARWWLSEAEQTKRAIRSLPRTPIRDVRDGELVRIVGKLRYLAEPTVAPLSGRRCAYFEARAFEKQGRSGLTERAMEGGGVEFLLEDETGRAVIDPVLLRAAVVEDVKSQSGIWMEPSPRMEAFLTRHALATTGALGLHKAIFYREGVFEEGETITVVGLGTSELDPSERTSMSSYRSRSMRLRISAPADGHVLISDHPSVTKA